MNKKISVIIPAFNCEKSIRRTLASVLTESDNIHEILVIDDGSTDKTLDVVNQTCPDATILQIPNSGPSVARNIGLKKATGEYIAFLDADDRWYPGFTTLTTKFLNDNNDCSAVSVGQIFMHAGRSPTFSPTFLGSYQPKDHCFQRLDNFWKFWSVHDHIRTGGALFKQHCFDENCLFREDLRLAEDIELWGLLGADHGFGFIPTTLWEGNSEIFMNLNPKYNRTQIRSKGNLCIENWEMRIKSKLYKIDSTSFYLVRNRVAASYIRFLLSISRIEDAFKIFENVQNIGNLNGFPTSLNRYGRFGIPGYLALSKYLQIKYKMRNKILHNMYCKNYEHDY